MTDFRYPKSRRLLCPKDFKRVYARAKRFSDNNIAICVRSNDESIARIGFSFTRKRVKSSVNRNKLKRICRESFRLVGCDLPAVDIIVMVRTSIDQVDRQATNMALEKLWETLRKEYGSKTC